MIDAISLTGTLHNGINEFIIFGILAIILAKKGVGHKNLIRIIMAIAGLRGLNALSWWMDAYYHMRTMRSACFRELIACSGTILIAYLAVVIMDVIKTLVYSQEATESRERILTYLDTEQKNKIVEIDRQSKQQLQDIRLAVRGGGA